jgi:hypothetical protein
MTKIMETGIQDPWASIFSCNKEEVGISAGTWCGSLTWQVVIRVDAAGSEVGVARNLLVG